MNPARKPQDAKRTKLQSEGQKPEFDLPSDTVQRLVAAHPLIFRGKPPRVESDLPPGWYDLVSRLCRQIEAELGDHAAHFRVVQMKEKFGGLRFYWSWRGRTRPTVDILSPSGHARLEQPARNEVSARIDTLVAAAEAESARTCEQCGAAAKLRSSRSGWLRVRCTKHARSK